MSNALAALASPHRHAFPCAHGRGKDAHEAWVTVGGIAWRYDEGLSMQTDVLAKFRTEELNLPSNFIQNNYVRARKLHSIPFM